MRLLLLICCVFPSILTGQELINESLQHDGIEREFILNIPASYDGNEAAPVIFNFHGFGSNANQQMFYGDFRLIAEAEGIILVHPEGTLIQGQAHWNVGFAPDDSEADDIGFTEAMIEYLIENYNIDENRIYATGMSNGGFMSYLLACQLGDKFAAIASVTGSMTPETFENCVPTHPTPIMQIHGTNDETVPYNGADFSVPIDEVMSYWVSYNNCDDNPESIEIEDVNASDGNTASYFRYSDCDNNITNELFRINNGSHTWPGAIFVFPGTNLDINASEEIWNFFSKYDLNGRLSSSTEDKQDLTSVNVYPNPTTGLLYVDAYEGVEYKMYNVLGHEVLNLNGKINNKTIDLSGLEKGLYFLKIQNEIFKIQLID